MYLKIITTNNILNDFNIIILNIYNIYAVNINYFIINISTLTNTV